MEFSLKSSKNFVIVPRVPTNNPETLRILFFFYFLLHLLLFLLLQFYNPPLDDRHNQQAAHSMADLHT